MNTPEDLVEDLLAGIPGSRPCAVERNVELAKALRHFLGMKARGETHVSLQHIYENGLKEAYNGPSMTTIRRWVQNGA